jgi:hypothetical protein
MLLLCFARLEFKVFQRTTFFITIYVQNLFTEHVADMHIVIEIVKLVTFLETIWPKTWLPEEPRRNYTETHEA